MKTLTAFFSLLFLSASFAQADLVIDVSGANGRDGSNGRGGIGSGDDGDNAGPSSAGKNAGNIDIRLKDLGDGVVAISGTHNQSFPTERVSGALILKANGGKGGDGGNGGDGSKGRTGSSGRDASRISSGTDGGPGGRGGDGGNGTSGSDGGAAGTITVTVKEKDMHLLYLVSTPEVRGGSGGRRGQNGRGGPGGDGGRGGSSYSWTESYSDTCSGSKSVRNGDGTSTSVSYTYSCTKTRSESNSGGSRGWDGPSGSSGTAYLTDGATRANGSYEYVVEYDNGTIGTYTRPFDLEITGFTLATDFSDQFVQPAEKMMVSSITLENVGGMPSPTKTPIRLRTHTDLGGILSANPSAIDIHTSIAPGASLEVQGTLATEVLRSALDALSPEGGVHRGGPRKKIKLAVSSEIVGINRYARGFTSYKSLLLRYPVSLSRVLGKRSIGQGDDYAFRWSVDNASKYELGSRAEHPRPIRFVTSFEFKSGKNSGTHTLRSAGKGAQVIESVGSRDKQGKSQESSLYGARLGFTSRAELLDDGMLKVVAEIEDPYVKGQWLPVDVAYLPVKVGSPFSKTPGAKVLLVISPQTDAKELAAWKKLISDQLQYYDVWDIGIQGPLDLDAFGLAEHYAGGTVVVLNDLFAQPGGERIPVDATFKLSPGAFVKRARESKISVFIVDRTGSYKARAGLFGSGKTLQQVQDPVLVAAKLKEQEFKSPDFILGEANRLSLSMALTFERKLEEFSRAVQLRSEETAQSLLNAIMTDLTLEQLRARAGEGELPLLNHLVEKGLMKVTLTGPMAMKSAFVQMTLAFMARLSFLADVQDRVFNGVSEEIQDKIEVLLLKTFGARDSFWASSRENEAAGMALPIIATEIEKLKEQTRRIEEDFVNGDKTRYFTFPRKWNGDYYRQAAYSLILRPVYDRTYTPRIELLDGVMKDDRQALPAFQ